MAKRKTKRPAITQLRVHPTHVSGKGQWYRVDRLDGTTLVPRSRDPEHDAARALLALNVKGQFQTFFGDRPYPSFFPRDIARTALYTISEEGRRGLIRRKWAPMPARP